MKFLLNMNLPRSIGRQLKTLGHSYRHVRDIGKSKASDLEIVIEAKSNKEVIITHDLDYGHLLTFSGEKEPSVIIFRLRNSHPDNLCKSICIFKLKVYNYFSGFINKTPFASRHYRGKTF